ncbi:MAG: hypothetical protein NTY47_07300, partial [Candidatus Omnitrophica bacterium]|nr:hypothetical protein [Candidatus Omnitrophota bacterium]
EQDVDVFKLQHKFSLFVLIRHSLSLLQQTGDLAGLLRQALSSPLGQQNPAWPLGFAIPIHCSALSLQQVVPPHTLVPGSQLNGGVLSTTKHFGLFHVPASITLVSPILSLASPSGSVQHI